MVVIFLYVFFGILLQHLVQPALMKTEVTLMPGKDYNFFNPKFTDASKTGYAMWKFQTRDNNKIKINCTIEHEMICGYDELLVSSDGQENLLGAKTYCDLSHPVFQVSNGHQLNVGIISSPSKVSYFKKFSCDVKADPIPKEACECGGDGNPNVLLFLLYVAENIQRVFCQGTIIHKMYVLTTALCVEDYERDPTKIRVLVGETKDVKEVKNYLHRQTFVVIEVIIHENYASQLNDYVGVLSNNAYNIALLKLNAEIQFKNNGAEIGIACLPFKYPLNLHMYTQSAYMHGYLGVEKYNFMSFDVMPEYQCDWKDKPYDWDVCVSPNIPRDNSEVYRHIFAGGGLILKDRRSYIKGINIHYGFSETYSPLSMLEIYPFIGWIQERTEVEFCKA